MAWCCVRRIDCLRESLGCVCGGITTLLRSDGEATPHGCDDAGMCHISSLLMAECRVPVDAVGACSHRDGWRVDRVSPCPSNRSGIGTAMSILFAFVFRALCGARARWLGCEPAGRCRLRPGCLGASASVAHDVELGLEQMHHPLQRLIDRRRNAMLPSAPHDDTVQVVDLGTSPARQVLRCR